MTGLSKLCEICGQEIRIVVSHSTNYSSGEGFSLSIVAKCGCSKRTPGATDLDTIRFGGELPDGW